MRPGHPMQTRRQLLLSGVGAAAAATLGAAASPGAAGASGASPVESEAMHVYRLLSVEQLMLFTYDQLLVAPAVTPRTLRALAPLRAQEEAHIHVLAAHLAALGGVAPSPPASVAAANVDLARRRVKGRLGQLRGDRDALRLLISTERVVVGAYFVALTMIEDRRLIVLATRIMANDAQHEALIGELLYSGDTQKAVPYGLVQGVQ
jgi:Ferritin-like domain